MSRGDIVIAAAPGDFGKPRPAVIVQSDRLSEVDSVIICPLTSAKTEWSAVRLIVEPSAETGLSARSEVMTEKIITVRPSKIGKKIGALPPDLLGELDRRLALVLGLADD